MLSTFSSFPIGGPATLGGIGGVSRGGGRGGGGGSDDSDVDGAPMQPTTSGGAKSSDGAAGRGFVKSKWETVDPEEVQAQAVTSKWDLFDQPEEDSTASARRKGVTAPDDDDDDVDGVPMSGYDNQVDLRLSEDRRARLREVELKVMTYQDELETGRQAVRPGWTISEQVCSRGC